MKLLSLAALAGFFVLVTGCASTSAFTAPQAELEIFSQPSSNGYTHYEQQKLPEMSFEFHADDAPELVTEKPVEAREIPAQSFSAPTSATRGIRLDEPR